MAIELNTHKMLGLRLLTSHGQHDVRAGQQSVLSSKNGKPGGAGDFPVLCLKEGKPNGPLRFKPGLSILSAKVGKQDGITPST